MHTMRRLSGLTALLVSSALSQNEDVVRKLDEAVTVYQNNRHFIGTVLVAKRGQILLERGYGMANIEWDLRNGPGTKFRVGSLTKPFTATAILQLQEKGKLSVTDAACKYFDGCPESWRKITIRQLLSHTSGIPSYTDDPDFTNPRRMRLPLSPAEILLLTKDKPLEFEPGTGWKYDNSGYIFLGCIVEKVSGEKYADYVKRHIFAPLEMNDSGYDETAMILKQRASGYRTFGPGFANAEYIDMSLPFAAGSLYSTVGDLYRWDRALYTEKVLTSASREQMFTAVRNNYGYGVILAPAFGRKHIGHSGGINGFSAFFSRFPEEDATVIVLSNNSDGRAPELAFALAGTLLGEDVRLPVEEKVFSLDSHALNRYAGVYEMGPGGNPGVSRKLTITNDNGHLMVTADDGSKFEAFAASETRFSVKDLGVLITFVLGDDGKAVAAQSEIGGRTIVRKRVQ